jgi:hypothetical protein
MIWVSKGGAPAGSRGVRGPEWRGSLGSLGVGMLLLVSAPAIAAGRGEVKPLEPGVGPVPILALSWADGPSQPGYRDVGAGAQPDPVADRSATPAWQAWDGPTLLWQVGLGLVGQYLGYSVGGLVTLFALAGLGLPETAAFLAVMAGTTLVGSVGAAAGVILGGRWREGTGTGGGVAAGVAIGGLLGFLALAGTWWTSQDHVWGLPIALLVVAILAPLTGAVLGYHLSVEPLQPPVEPALAIRF